MGRLARAAPVLALLGVTAVWGWTFVVVRDAVHGYPVLPFLAIRFAIAAVALCPILLRRASGLRAGLFPGLLLAGGYLTQTFGLRYTTASKAGLLTGLLVVLTPVLVFVFLRQRPPFATIVAITGALIGTTLLVDPGGSGKGSQEVFGDGLEVLTALLFSAHILALARQSSGQDAGRMALTQMVTSTVLFSGGSAISGTFPLPGPSVWAALIITGVLASAVAFWVQTYVQQHISPSRTAIILASEPAFATFFGLALAGDRFGLLQGAGAGLILISIGFHELRPGPQQVLQSVGS